MDKINYVNLIMVFATWSIGLCKKISLRPEKINKKILFMLECLSWTYLGLGCININVSALLVKLFQNVGFYIGLLMIVFLLAWLPSVFARLDRMVSEAAATDSYIKNNCVFNLCGAISVLGMLGIMLMEIDKEEFWTNFPITSVASLCIPLGTSIVLAYQSIEQNFIKPADHDTSLKWKNQRWNMIYLFVVYFLAIFSTITLFCYTLYFHNQSLEKLEFNIGYFIFLFCVLLFFFLCGFHPYGNVYMVFAIYVPVILVASSYWMSWFETPSNEILQLELIFMFLSLMGYISLVYKRTHILVFGRQAVNANTSAKYLRLGPYMAISHWFFITPYILLIICYILFFVIPFSI